MNKNFIRIIPKLEIKNGLLIKGINLDGLRILGKPFSFAQNYYHQGADEIFYVDIVSSLYGTTNLIQFVKKSSKNLFVPFSVGGGINSIDQIEKFLNAGADKISINSAALNNINFLKNSSRIFGSSTITSMLEVIKFENRYYLTKENGRDIVKIDPIEWACRVEDAGAGEIFLTSINKDGTKEGFDIKLTKKVSEKVNIPVIAHGGAGSFDHVFEIINNTNICGVSIASFFHYDICSSLKSDLKIKNGNTYYLNNLKKDKPKNQLTNLKKYLKKKGVNIRI